MPDPNPSIWNATDTAEVSAINYGTGDAGTYLLLEAGTEYHVWNDKGNIKKSSTMISVKVSARDDNGDEVKNITKQHWVEIKSSGVGATYDDFATTDVNVDTEQITVNIDIPTGERIKFTTTGGLPAPLVVGTIYYAIRVDATHIKVATTLANANAGTAINLTTQGTGTHTVTIYMMDDVMTEFQPVGLNAPLAIGDIPANCYRKIWVRVHLPNSAIEGAVTFQIYILNQEPSTPIAKWITGLHGNGVVYQIGGAFAVSINGVDDSLLDIEKGFAPIDNLETYYGAGQQYDVSGLENGTYKLYLTSVGIISAIISTSSIPANSIELSRVVVSGAVATSVTDKRLFFANIIVGLDAAKTATPTKNQVYIATDTSKIYVCFADNTWTQVIPVPNMVTKTGDFTAGKIVKINNATGIIEEGTNTELSIATALGDDHTYVGITDSKAVGENVVFGDLLYFDWTAGEWKKAKADVYATARSRRIALETKGDGQACLMLVSGYIRDDDAFEFTTATVFLSITTAGATQSTVPSVAGNQIQIVGTAISADIMEYSPSMDVGEV